MTPSSQELAEQLRIAAESGMKQRKAAADRLWSIVTMCDAGKPVSDIREALRFTAFAMENPSWDGRETTPLNREAVDARG